MAETVLVKQVTLPAAPERIFWDLLDPAAVPEYDSHMRSWQPRELPLREGSRVDYEARVGRRWMKVGAVFTAFDPPRHLAVRQVSPPSPLRSSLTWDLEPFDGGTRFTYRFVVTGPPGTGWIRRRLLAMFTSHLDVELPALADRYRDAAGAADGLSAAGG
jgi:uncharacterized protein YndB with AHSA1/START domain